MANWRPYYQWSLKETGLLPNRWEAQVRSVVRRYGIDTVLSGEGSTSREAKTDQKIAVRVADGNVVKRRLPWLWELYEGPLLDFASKQFGRRLYPANLVHSAVNINYLSGVGARYEWHVDSNPVTGLLFATTCEGGLGGSLVFKKRSRRAIVRPRSGVFICFDARQIPHRVAPLRKGGERISIPMNYYLSATEQLRPADLDEQIYTPASGMTSTQS